SRVERWATAKEGQGSALAARAAQIKARARGRVAAFGANGGSADWVVQNRMRAWEPPEREEPWVARCPPSQAREVSAREAMEAEPVPEGGTALSCWDALVSSGADDATSAGDPVALARAFLAIAERPHRALLAITLIDRLREKVALRPSGAISLPDA